LKAAFGLGSSVKLISSYYVSLLIYYPAVINASSRSDAAECSVAVLDLSPTGLFFKNRKFQAKEFFFSKTFRAALGTICPTL
jgi:hypothetical protein